MECLFGVFLGHDLVHLSFHFQVLWPGIIVINRGCWCSSMCFRTSSRTYPRVPSGCVFENLTLCALSPIAFGETCFEKILRCVLKSLERSKEDWCVNLVHVDPENSCKMSIYSLQTPASLRPRTSPPKFWYRAVSFPFTLPRFLLCSPAICSERFALRT